MELSALLISTSSIVAALAWLTWIQVQFLIRYLSAFSLPFLVNCLWRSSLHGTVSYRANGQGQREVHLLQLLWQRENMHQFN